MLYSMPRINPVSRQAEGLRFWVPPMVRPHNVIDGQLLSLGSEMITGAGKLEICPEGLPMWLYFGGDSYDIFDPTNATWLNGLTTFSVAAWIRTRMSGTISQNIILAKHSAGTDGTFYLALTDPSTIRMAVVNSASSRKDHDVSYDLQNGMLYHVAATYDGANIRIYVNGVEIGSPTAQTGGLKTYATALRIGNYSGVAWNMHGRVGDARVYTRCLTTEDVSAMYDPRTRWELYAQPPRVFATTGSAPPVTGRSWAVMIGG